jgi:hypothetical protein
MTITCSITLANTDETPLTDNLARLVEIEASLLSTPSVQKDTCLAEALSTYLLESKLNRE